MILNYYGIWRDLISDSRDIQGVLEGLTERYFPFSHGLYANPNDFRYLHTDERNIRVVFSVANLPPYVFEKNLQLNALKVEVKKPQGFLGRLFRPTNPSEIIKFSKNDSNLLLGANTLEELIELILNCGFRIEDADKLYERFDINLKYQAIYNEKVIRKSDCLDLFITLYELGANFDNIHVENAAIKSISPDRQTVVINGKTVKLFPLLFQAKIVHDSPIVYGAQKPFWLVLGANTMEDLQELVKYLGVSFDDLMTTSVETQTYQRRPIPKEVQLFVWKRDNGRCVECGSKDNLEFDHIIPISKGGSNTVRNIQLLCEKCNRKKGNNIG